MLEIKAMNSEDKDCEKAGAFDTERNALNEPMSSEDKDCVKTRASDTERNMPEVKDVNSDDSSSSSNENTVDSNVERNMPEVKDESSDESSDHENTVASKVKRNMPEVKDVNSDDSSNHENTVTSNVKRNSHRPKVKNGDSSDVSDHENTVAPNNKRRHTAFVHIISGHEIVAEIENDQNSNSVEEVKSVQSGKLVRKEKREHKKEKEFSSESSSSEEEKRKKKERHSKKHKKEKKSSKSHKSVSHEDKMRYRIKERDNYVHLLNSDEDSASIDDPNNKRVEQQPSSQVEKAKVPLTYEERLQLEEQIRKFVQLLTQSYLLSFGIPEFQAINASSKRILEDILKISHEFPPFHAHNLNEALDIVDSFQKKQNFRIRSNFNLARRTTGIHHIDIKKAIFNSKVFMYPELLPPNGFGCNPKNKAIFNHAEDNLIALGLERFSSIKFPAYPIHSYLVPVKTVTQIKFRIKNSKTKGGLDNPIKYFFTHNKCPPFSRVVKEFNPDNVKAPKDQPLTDLPPWAVSMFQKPEDDTQVAKNSEVAKIASKEENKNITNMYTQLLQNYTLIVPPGVDLSSFTFVVTAPPAQPCLPEPSSDRLPKLMPKPPTLMPKPILPKPLSNPPVIANLLPNKTNKGKIPDKIKNNVAANLDAEDSSNKLKTAMGEPISQKSVSNFTGYAEPRRLKLQEVMRQLFPDKANGDNLNPDTVNGKVSANADAKDSNNMLETAAVEPILQKSVSNFPACNEPRRLQQVVTRQLFPDKTNGDNLNPNTINGKVSANADAKDSNNKLETAEVETILQKSVSNFPACNEPRRLQQVVTRQLFPDKTNVNNLNPDIISAKGVADTGNAAKDSHKELKTITIEANPQDLCETRNVTSSNASTVAGSDPEMESIGDVIIKSEIVVDDEDINKVENNGIERALNDIPDSVVKSNAVHYKNFKKSKIKTYSKQIAEPPEFSHNGLKTVIIGVNPQDLCKTRNETNSSASTVAGSDPQMESMGDVIIKSEIVVDDEDINNVENNGIKKTLDEMPDSVVKSNAVLYKIFKKGKIKTYSKQIIKYPESDHSFSAAQCNSPNARNSRIKRAIDDMPDSVVKSNKFQAVPYKNAKRIKIQTKNSQTSIKPSHNELKTVEIGVNSQDLCKTRNETNSSASTVAGSDPQMESMGDVIIKSEIVVDDEDINNVENNGIKKTLDEMPDSVVKSNAVLYKIFKKGKIKTYSKQIIKYPESDHSFSAAQCNSPNARNSRIKRAIDDMPDSVVKSNKFQAVPYKNAKRIKIQTKNSQTSIKPSHNELKTVEIGVNSQDLCKTRNETNSSASIVAGSDTEMESIGDVIIKSEIVVDNEDINVENSGIERALDDIPDSVVKSNAVHYKNFKKRKIKTYSKQITESPESDYSFSAVQCNSIKQEIIDDSDSIVGSCMYSAVNDDSAVRTSNFDSNINLNDCNLQSRLEATDVSTGGLINPIPACSLNIVQCNFPIKQEEIIDDNENFTGLCNIVIDSCARTSEFDSHFSVTDSNIPIKLEATNDNVESTQNVHDSSNIKNNKKTRSTKAVVKSNALLTAQHKISKRGRPRKKKRRN